MHTLKALDANYLRTMWRRLRGAREAELFGPRGRLPTRRARHEAERGPGRAGGRDARRAGAEACRTTRALARRGDQRPPGEPQLPRHVREPAVRGSPSAAAPRHPLADRTRVRRRRAGRPAPVADRRNARDPGALPARQGAVRPSHRPGRRRLRRRLAAADLVRAGGADVRVRDAVRPAGAVDAAACDPQPELGELGGVHPRDRRAAVVSLLRTAPDRRAAAHLGGGDNPSAPRPASRSGRSCSGSPTRLPCSSSSSSRWSPSPREQFDSTEAAFGSPRAPTTCSPSTPLSRTWRGRSGATTRTGSPSCCPPAGRCCCSSRCSCSGEAGRARRSSSRSPRSPRS